MPLFEPNCIIKTIQVTEGHVCSSPVLEEQWCSIRYGLDGPGIESRSGDEIFHTHPDRPWGTTRLCTVDTLFLSLGQSGRGMMFTTHTYLAPRLKKEYRYTSTPPLGLHGLLQGELFNSAATWASTLAWGDRWEQHVGHVE